ncbi:unnamed protein product [Malus baccata var. baccata]
MDCAGSNYQVEDSIGVVGSGPLTRFSDNSTHSVSRTYCPSCPASQKSHCNASHSQTASRTRASKPFEKQLAQNDVTRDLRLKDCDVETHILQLLNPSEDPKQGIWITAYDIAGSEYKKMFKATRVGNNIQALTSVGWKHFVKHHGLVKCQDFVTLWGFRNAQTGKLCFVICLRYGLQHEKV